MRYIIVRNGSRPRLLIDYRTLPALLDFNSFLITEHYYFPEEKNAFRLNRIFGPVPFINSFYNCLTGVYRIILRHVSTNPFNIIRRLRIGNQFLDVLYEVSRFHVIFT